MQTDDEKIIIIPTELDAQTVDAAAAVQSLLDQIMQTGDQLDAARLDALRAIKTRAAELAALDALRDQISAQERAMSTAEAEARAATGGSSVHSAEAEAAAMLLQHLPESRGMLVTLDKVSSKLCELPPGETVPLKAESNKDAAQGLCCNILARLSTKPGSGLTLDRPITSYESRVLCAAMGIYHDAERHARENGEPVNCTFSLNQLFDRMGGGSCPGVQQRQRLENALDRLLSTLITIDNSDERRLYPDRPAAFYRMQLLQGGYGGYITRGGLDARAIRIDAKPVLLEFAERRGNVRTVPLEVFRDGESMTDRSLATADYLIRRIAHMMKIPTITRTIRLETVTAAVIRATGADPQTFGRKQRQRLADSVKSKLTHYSRAGWIRGYSISGGAVHIDL